MKIVNINKYYYKKGGSEAYYFALSNLLQENNIEVIPFSMNDDNNLYTKYSQFFINNIDYKSIKSQLKNSFKIMYSLESKNKIRKLINSTHPSIAHFHIFQHQITSSVVFELKKNNIKTVNTIHDFKVICPNYKMLNRNGICEECRGNKYYKCFKNSCMKDSKAKSFAAMCEAYFNKLIRSYKLMDMFICPSEFYKNKLLEFGMNKEKVITIPNFIDIDKFQQGANEENYFLYAGRLSEEKGILMLLRVMEQIKDSYLYIAGTGPLEMKLKKQAEEKNLYNVKFLGYKSEQELGELIRNSKFVVVPSIWYENCPMIILEAMAYGKTILGSNMGGIPELVLDSVNGLIFENEEELKEKINILLKSYNMRNSMGQASRIIAEEKYNKYIHFNKIYEVYNKLLK